MRNWIKWLREKEQILARLQGQQEPDFDDIFHTLTDEEIECMARIESDIQREKYALEK